MQLPDLAVAAREVNLQVLFESGEKNPRQRGGDSVSHRLGVGRRSLSIDQPHVHERAVAHL